MSFASELSTASFNTEVLQTPGVVQVVQLHTDWAGPCSAVTSTLKSLYFSYSDRPLKFYTANTDKVANKMLDPYKGKCQPVFMLFKGGVLKKTVQGVQGPELVQSIVSLSDPASGSA